MKTETKTIYDHKDNTSKDSPKSSTDRRRKQTKLWEGGKYQTTGKETESSNDSAVHNQTLKQQKQLNGRNHHIPINVNTESQWTQLPHQKTLFSKLD
jgi:hypothetical protein